MKRRIFFLGCGAVCFFLLLAGALRAVRDLRSIPPAPESVLRRLVQGIRNIGPLPRQEPQHWSAADIEAKANLEMILRAREPVQRIVYGRSQQITGRIEKEMPDAVVFTERFGENGEMSVTIPRADIVRIETLDMQLPELSLRDVRFFREFPQQCFYKKPPYTIVSDESFFEIKRIVAQQQTLYEQFTQFFAPLLTTAERRSDIQLLIFSNAALYGRYLQQNAPGFSGSLGVYDIRHDRLTVLHQRNADWSAEARRKINAIEKEHSSSLTTSAGRRHLSIWKQDAMGDVAAKAVDATRQTLRHEGAHQLAFSLGVQNARQQGRAWLTEGLAVFFEPDIPGGANPARSAELREAFDAGVAISLNQLLAASRLRTPREYAQAGALFGRLMQPDLRAGFFDYLAWLRGHPLPSVRNPSESLCCFLPLTPAALETVWIGRMKQEAAQIRPKNEL